MRKFFTVLLLVCLGMVLPLAAVQTRVCLLNAKERQEDCCTKKCDPDRDNCCAVKDKAPDSPAPGGSMEIPPFVPVEIPVFEPGLQAEAPLVLLAPRFSQPIRGPDSPAAFRSILSVWRL